VPSSREYGGFAGCHLRLADPRSQGQGCSLARRQSFNPAPDRPANPSVASPDTRRSLAVVPLIADHEDLIEDDYDCVDRLVVNCYYPLGQAGGGFRTFWRQWKGGDSGLSDQALRQAAGDMARRLKAHCQKHGILWIECAPDDHKYKIAREHRPQDPAFRGVFAVLVGRAPAPL
jgi:hypothetical protein